MNIKVSTSILVIIVLLGISTNTVAYAQQIITPQQPISDVIKPTQTLNPNPNLNNEIQSASIDLINSAGLGQYSQSNLLINCPTGVVIYPPSLITNQLVPICVTSDMTNQLFNIDFNVKDDDDDDDDDNDDNNRRHHNNDNNHGPDRDCLFHPSLPKCETDGGDCPKGFFQNGYDQCVPDHHNGCPNGYHGVDDDETGQCIDNKKGCPDEMEFNDKGNNCTYKPDIPEEQKQEIIRQLQALQLQEQKQTNTNLGNPIPLVDLTKDPVNPVIPFVDVTPEVQEPITTTSDTSNGNNNGIEADTATTTTTTEQSNTLATLDNTATAAETTTEQPTNTETTEEHDVGEDIDENDIDTEIDTHTDSDSGDSSGNSEGDGGNSEESEE